MTPTSAAPHTALHRAAAIAAIAAAALLAAWPSTANEPGPATIAADADLPDQLHWTRSDSGLWATTDPVDANNTVLLGADWGGDESTIVQVRTATNRQWSEWHTLHHIPDHAPDDPEDETGGQVTTVSDPLWLGDVDHLQVRTTADTPDQIVLHGVAERPGDPDGDPDPQPRDTANDAAHAFTSRPNIISRAQWGADETIRRTSGRAATQLRFGVVHHTATRNDYSCSSSAAIVRSIYRYHVNTNGWADIGYNYLIDRCGQVFHGRYGAEDTAVIGAHAGGFNTGSVGVGVIGDFRHTDTPDAAYTSLVNLLAWRFDLEQLDPQATTFHTVTGNGTYWPSGTTVEIPTIVGHGDTRATSCPGTRLATTVQARTLAADVAAAGAPKYFQPLPSSASFTLGDGQLALDTRANERVTWQLNLFDSSDTRTGPVATGTTTGSEHHINVRWDGQLDDGSYIEPGSYRARLSAVNSSNQWARPLEAAVTIAAGNTTPAAYQLAAGTDGEGEVTTDPQRSTFTAGETVTLTAEPADGWRFDGWSSGSTANPLTLHMTQDRSLDAQFVPVRHTLTTPIDGDGSVHRSPSRTTYAHDTNVTLTAEADLGWRFDQWSTGSSDPTITTTLDQARTITATFTPRGNHTLPAGRHTPDQWLVGDWNGDGDSSLGWRVGTRITLVGHTGTDSTFTYGRRGDTYLVGDWNGDGRDTIGVVRGNRWLLRNTHADGSADIRFAYGRADDQPIVGDWNGDGRDTAGVVRGRSWFVTNSHEGGGADIRFTYGRADDQPIVGDWNGDGRDTAGVVRGRSWFVTNSHEGGGADHRFSYGWTTDQATPASLTGSDTTVAAVIRPDGRQAQLYLRYSLTGGRAEKTLHVR